jgi:hypothetical protein
LAGHALVSQYQVEAGGRLRVQFDPAALRRRLDAANLPVWAAERPATLIMLFGVDAPDAPGSDGQLVLDTAASRGLPVVMSLSPDGAIGATADAGMRRPKPRSRIADLVLIGSRSPVSGVAAWRWTLIDSSGRVNGRRCRRGGAPCWTSLRRLCRGGQPAACGSKCRASGFAD